MSFGCFVALSRDANIIITIISLLLLLIIIIIIIVVVVVVLTILSRSLRAGPEADCQQLGHRDVVRLLCGAEP